MTDKPVGLSFLQVVIYAGVTTGFFIFEMPMNFQSWSTYVLAAEGRYSNHKDDRGGETHYGFTKQFLIDIGEEPPKTIHSAKYLLKKYIWDEHHCNEMDWFVAWCCADAFMNHKPRQAAKCLQAGLNVRQDGVVGPITLKASKNVVRIDFWLRYSRRRIRLFFAIVRQRKSQHAFLEGWMNRLHLLSGKAYKSRP